MTGKPDPMLVNGKLVDIKTGPIMVPKLMGRSDIVENFSKLDIKDAVNWTIIYNKDARWDVVAKAMKVFKKGYAKSMLNKTPAKMSIRFFDEYKDKYLPNQDNLLVSITPPQNGLRYKGCPIKKYDSAIIAAYSQHIEFILTLDCESYRDAIKLAHKLKRLKTINSVDVQIDNLKFK